MVFAELEENAREISQSVSAKEKDSYQSDDLGPLFEFLIFILLILALQ